MPIEKVNLITHKEIQIIYGMKRNSAVNRLASIKAALGKKRDHKLSVFAFCEHENLKIEEFEMMYERAMSCMVRS